MAVRLHNLVLHLDDDEALLRPKAAARLQLPVEALVDLCVVRRSVDARRGGVRFVYSVDVEVDDPRAALAALERGAKPLPREEAASPPPGSEEVRGRVAVVGCGPAGLFAGLELARWGYAPLVIERGDPIAERHRAVKAFHEKGALDPDSNVVFGAGGAGTYSDGKLGTRIRDPRLERVFDVLVEAGAPGAIRIDARPHIGTDRLRPVVARLCARLVALGGDIVWRTRLTGLRTSGGRLAGLETTGGFIETNCAELAPGANGKDTFRTLRAAGVALAPKPFQMGVRIEHPRELIDAAVYGRHAGHPKLGAAEYVLSAEGVTAFCVCPGGVVVAASAEPGTVCTNGMSNSSRNGAFTNAALVATLRPEAAASDPLAGLELQARLERAAFERAGQSYAAPAQRASDYAAHRVSRGPLKGTYPFGLTPTPLADLLPKDAAQALAAALKAFSRRIPGFGGEAGMLVAPETRASCPVRLLREHTGRASESVDGLYPCGEGSGYSSGIASSAVDGIRTAEAVRACFARPG
jgi:hypothetical protein